MTLLKIHNYCPHQWPCQLMSCLHRGFQPHAFDGRPREFRLEESSILAIPQVDQINVKSSVLLRGGKLSMQWHKMYPQGWLYCWPPKEHNGIQHEDRWVALHRMGWHYVLHTFWCFVGFWLHRMGKYCSHFGFSTPDIVSIVGIAIPFDFWTPGHL